MLRIRVRVTAPRGPAQEKAYETCGQDYTPDGRSGHNVLCGHDTCSLCRRASAALLCKTSLPTEISGWDSTCSRALGHVLKVASPHWADALRVNPFLFCSLIAARAVLPTGSDLMWVVDS